MWSEEELEEQRRILNDNYSSINSGERHIHFSKNKRNTNMTPKKKKRK